MIHPWLLVFLGLLIFFILVYYSIRSIERRRRPLEDPESIVRNAIAESPSFLYERKRSLTWVETELDKLANEIDDIRDDFVEAVPLPTREEDLTKHGRRMASIQDRLLRLSTKAEEIYQIVKELKEESS